MQQRQDPEQNKEACTESSTVSHSWKVVVPVYQSAVGILALFIRENTSIPHDVFDVIHISQTAISHRQKNSEGRIKIPVDYFQLRMHQILT